MNKEKQIINNCLTQIERDLGWGNSEGWSNCDFEALSEKIFQKTQIKLSVTTLKRIWGKVKYNSAPNITTLNALSQFVGFENWRAYKQNQLKLEITKSLPERKNKRYWNRKYGKNVLWLIFGIIGLFIMIGILGLFIKANRIDPKDFEFNSKKTVSEGVPNSVVFEYNALASPYDSVYIQQSWDNRRRTAVSKYNKKHTSIYYYPGYFKAKLVVGATIVKEHDLFITSRGWTAAINLDPIPAYLKQEDFLNDGIVDVSAELIKALQIPMQPKTPELRIHYVQQMDNLQNDNFTFQTYVRNDFIEGTGACQKIQVFILCKNDVFIIPLCSKRCIGNLDLIIADHYANSQNVDLSGFGTDLQNWTELKITSIDKNVSIFINGQEVYETKFLNPTTEIVGVQYRFEGLGAVKETSFANAEREFMLTGN